MTYWTGPAAVALDDDRPIKLRWAFWAQPKDAGGVPTVIALWTGVVAQSLTLDGVTEAYLPIGDVLEIGDIRYTTGTQVSYLDLALPLTDEGVTFLRTLNSRLAPCRLHALMYGAETGAFLGSRRYWKGFVEEASINYAEEGGASTGAIRMASSLRRGTLTRAGYKSDASQRLRDPNDAGRKYGSLTQANNDPWQVVDD